MISREFGSYRNWLIGIACVVCLFFLVQFILALIVKHYANAAINSYPGLYGEIGSVKLHFIPGKYLVQDTRFYYSKEGNREILHLKELGVRIYWKSLLKGTVEGDGWIESPHLIFWAPQKVKDAKLEKEVKKIRQADWQDQIRNILPIKINSFLVHNATISYRDVESKPRIDLTINDIDFSATNLTNREALKDSMFAKASLRGKIFDGRAKLDMLFDPLAKHPTFKLKSETTGIDLTKLNELLLAYGKFDVERGNFSLFIEAAAKNGKFIAYAKPIFRDIDVPAWQSREHPNNKLLLLWKNIVGLVVEILKNKEKDQIATKIKAEGSFTDPDISIIDAVISLVRNAFIQALIPGYDNSITWSDVPDESHKE